MAKAADIHLYIYLNPKQTEPNSCAAFNLLWSLLSVAKQNAIVAKAEATLVASCCLSLSLFISGTQSIFIGNMSYA